MFRLVALKPARWPTNWRVLELKRMWRVGVGLGVAARFGAVVKKVEEYRTHAAECLSLSRRTHSDEEKAQLVKMAEVWEALAVHREASQRGE